MSDRVSCWLRWARTEVCRTASYLGGVSAISSVGNVRIGISGWRYAGWRGVFYPPKLAQRRELEFAAGKFPSVEINGTFYSLQKPEFFREWARVTPEDFVFAVKGSRYITHMLKLRGVEQALANFFASGLLELGSKMGPMLWQFAPQMRLSATGSRSSLRSCRGHMGRRRGWRDTMMRGWMGAQLRALHGVRQICRFGMRWRFAMRALQCRSLLSFCVSTTLDWWLRILWRGHCWWM